MPSVPQLYDTQGKNRPRQSGGRTLWTLFLGGVLALQLWSVGSLSSYALVLSDSYARHEELQTSLRDAELLVPRWVTDAPGDGGAAKPLDFGDVLRQRLAGRGPAPQVRDGAIRCS